MRLMEGMAARAIIFLPLIVIIGRSLLHPASSLLLIAVGTITVFYFIFDIKRYTQSPTFLYLSQWVGTIAAIATWSIVADHISMFSTSLVATISPVSLILFLMSSQVQYHTKSYRNLASLLAAFIAYSEMIDQLTLAPIYGIATGILLVIAGLAYKEKVPFFTGSICVTGGFLFYFEYALQFYSAAPWICSIILGLIVILLASYLENKEKMILQRSRQYLVELKSWA